MAPAQHFSEIALKKPSPEEITRFADMLAAIATAGGGALGGGSGRTDRASNFFELAVGTAAALFGPESGAVLATVVGVLVEFAPAVGPWKERRAL